MDVSILARRPSDTSRRIERPTLSRAGVTAVLFATILGQAPPEQSYTRSCSRTASACRETGNRSSSLKVGRAPSSAIISRVQKRVASTRSSIIYLATPTTSTALRMGAIGRRFWASKPALDLALTMPDFRRRMAKRVARELWLFPNIIQVASSSSTMRGGSCKASIGSRRRPPSDDHIDARAQGLSLPWRRL